MPGHTHHNCPDRFSKGSNKGKPGSGKGFPGKSGKGKGPPRSVQYHDLSSEFAPSAGIFLSEASRGNRVIIDTGASENAVGTDALQRLIEAFSISYEVDTKDRPVFRFGNGLQSQAVSRVDLSNTALGNVSFYVLGGTACITPPLMGGRVLRKLGAILSYENNMFVYRRQEAQVAWFAVKMFAHDSHHVSIDLMESAVKMNENGMWFVASKSSDESLSTLKDETEVDKIKLPSILVMSSCGSAASDRSVRLSNLAQKLKAFRERAGHGTSASMCSGRSQNVRLSMLSVPQGEAAPESICHLWETCTICGLRTSYRSKKSFPGTIFVSSGFIFMTSGFEKNVIFCMHITKKSKQNPSKTKLKLKNKLSKSNNLIGSLDFVTL